MKAKVLVSPLDHPMVHLSLEEYYMKHDPLNAPLMFLYVNRPSVILGRNQNPWLECDLSAMSAEGALLARRITGGGTVYHDYGNLNYAFVYRSFQAKEEAVFKLVIDTLAMLGLNAEIGNRKELLLDTQKISGTAFGRYQDRVIQHGTLLLDADLSKLKRYLKGSDQIISTRSVKSVPSPVINLKSVKPDISYQDLIDAFYAQLDEVEEIGENDLFQILESEVYQGILNKNQSWKWIFGETPHFEIFHPEDLLCTLNVSKGKLQSVNQQLFNRLQKAMPYIQMS